ncbi:hypothetical protein Rhopal_004229-T1 [Rhodotorula paludigena]|uniref:Probable cytosolic iron-sulfur protein assembly protein 1 n=1 Tax=Rhodotorula paludigena TaxID=86838 RepID=A0AAV5GNT7_9BASI|nr:hypothetical protein Rhopal_004229-T1 [Rhodotorula paludigena]
MGALRLVDTLSGHQDRAWNVAWNPARPTLASCSTDKSVRLYSYAPAPAPAPDSADTASSSSSPSYRFSLESTIPTSHARTVRALAFSPTGATLATASFDSTVGVWCQVSEAGLDDGDATASAGEWEPVDPLEGHESECKSVAWSADGRLLASCSRDKSVWVWEAVGPADFECLAVLMEHSQDVKCVKWHPTDELLASASYDDTIKLYAADPYDDEWQCTHTLSSHSATVWALAFSPCGRYLASAGDDLCIRLHERVPQSPFAPGELGELGEARPEEGGRMGPWSAGGVRVGASEKWRWEDRGVIERAHDRTVYALDWQRGGTAEREGGLGRIVSGGGDGKINVFQMTAPPPSDGSSPNPSHHLVASVEDAHGVSDVNHVAWCTLSPARAAATLRALEGGEDDAEQEQEQDASGGGEGDDEADPRWEGARDLFASAGDDGLVKVWTVVA